MSHTLFDAKTGNAGKSSVVNCPQCGTNNVKLNGKLTINGASHDAYKCTHCNNDFSAITEGVQHLVQAVIDHPSLAGQKLNVGFTSASIVDSVNINANSNYGAAGGYGQNGYGQDTSVRVSNPAPDYNYKFDNISSAVYSVQTELTQLTMLMRGIVAEIKTMSEQNRQLMEKMAADPLIHVRKQVAEFNLE